MRQFEFEIPKSETTEGNPDASILPSVVNYTKLVEYLEDTEPLGGQDTSSIGYQEDMFLCRIQDTSILNTSWQPTGNGGRYVSCLQGNDIYYIIYVD